MTSSFYFLTVNYGGESFSIDGTYYPGSPDVPYLPNGDPGYPGDAEELEIETLRWHQEADLTDITPLLEAFSIRDDFTAACLATVRENWQETDNFVRGCDHDE